MNNPCSKCKYYDLDDGICINSTGTCDRKEKYREYSSRRRKYIRGNKVIRDLGDLRDEDVVFVFGKATSSKFVMRMKAETVFNLLKNGEIHTAIRR